MDWLKRENRKIYRISHGFYQQWQGGSVDLPFNTFQPILSNTGTVCFTLFPTRRKMPTSWTPGNYGLHRLSIDIVEVSYLISDLTFLDFLVVGDISWNTSQQSLAPKNDPNMAWGESTDQGMDWRRCCHPWSLYVLAYSILGGKKKSSQPRVYPRVN